MRKGIAHHIALGGILASVAILIMCLVGLIPVATFICPMLCILICAIVFRNCGSRIGWAWYGATALMCIFFAPDKEGVLIFLFLGYYPMLKVRIDRCGSGMALLYKALYFNCTISFLYFLFIRIIGLSDVLTEYRKFGVILGAITMLLGNIAFFLLDYILNRILPKKQ